MPSDTIYFVKKIVASADRNGSAQEGAGTEARLLAVHRINHLAAEVAGMHPAIAALGALCAGLDFNGALWAVTERCGSCGAPRSGHQLVAATAVKATLFRVGNQHVPGQALPRESGYEFQRQGAVGEARIYGVSTQVAPIAIETGSRTPTKDCACCGQSE
ncbi:hypothetical protein AWR36_005880 [Microbulbifer flavimaris]|uniref:Uncharacterized protein n=1 Tax=Microbulbifer flavimaris TaxID=1781068 RepID=A0ABX4I011_9GAMM|nr:hypothetical protein AVO43_05870 [Microbulbifer sp. ZGT114]PCO05548.1 hypothetical protein AWR36_005880 [Microbulbifer flavimaris]